MKAIAALLLLCCVARSAGALESRDVRGLQVTLEAIAEPVQVDGVSMRLQVATGPDVQRLAARIEQRWRAEGSVVERQQAASWQVRARLERGRNEVIQWRGAGDAAQLLHSTVDVMRAPATAAPPPFALPAGCTWLRSVRGAAGRERFEQRTATCGMSAERVITSLHGLLSAQGWTIEHAGPDGARLMHAGSEGLLRVTAGEGVGRSTLAWLGLRTGRSRP